MFMQNHPGYKYLAKLSIATLFMLPNLFYVRGVGTSAGGLAAFVMAPFVVLIALSFPYLEPNRLFLNTQLHRCPSPCFLHMFRNWVVHQKCSVFFTESL